MAKLSGKPNQKIGIFGGTFDPVHRGHVQILQAAQKHFRFDRVYVVPTRQNPLKESTATPRAERLRRLRQAIRPLKFARLSLVEWKGKGPSYTVDTLAKFRRRFRKAELFFICGSDNVRSFSRWKNPQRILELATMAVAHRGGFSKPTARRGWIVFPMKPVRISSTQIRAKM